MNDISGSPHPSTQNSSAHPTVHPTGFTAGFEQLCSDEAATLPSSEELKAKLVSIQRAATLGRTLTEDLSSPDGVELLSRARQGSMIHQQRRSLPVILGNSGGFLASVTRPSNGDSKKNDAVAAAVTKSAPTSKGSPAKGLLTTLFSSKDHKRQSMTQPRRRSTLDLSEPDTPKVATPPAASPSSNSAIETLLADGRKMVGLMERLANSCKNLTDVFSLTVPESMSVDDFSKQLIHELIQFKKALDEGKSPLPTVQNNVVPTRDVNATQNLARDIQNEEVLKTLFTDVIQRKNDLAHGRAFLSPKVMEAIQIMKNPDDAKMIATYLMSECTTSAGISRVIEPNGLKRLLADERIASLPNLQLAIKNAAIAVMHEAIRKCQGNIVFQEVKASGRPEPRSSLQQWENTAKFFEYDHHDLNGVNHIAKEAGLNLHISPREKDINQENLQKILLIKNEVFALINGRT